MPALKEARKIFNASLAPARYHDDILRGEVAGPQ